MEFIKSTVDNRDLHPWTDVHDQLMPWTVEASPSEVTRLEGHDGIDRVTKLEIPKDHNRLRRDDSLQQQFTIYPVDGPNLDQCNATDAYLRALLNDKVDKPMIWDGAVQSWAAFLTDAQVEQVEAIDGVEAVYPVHKGRRCRNLDQCNATGASLRALLNDKVKGPRIRDGTVKSWTASLTNIQVEQVKAIDGVRVVRPVYKGRRCRVARRLRKPSTSLEERGTIYETQQNAAPELVAISQPRYDDDDDENPSHGTCSAGKALGTQFGASKKAMLVVVKIHGIDADEFTEALGLIIDDLDEHPERRKKSVVSMSINIGQDWDADLRDEVRDLLNQLFDRDVPFVCIAGNIDEVDNDSEEVNEYPALLEGPDIPLIVVGSVNSEGALSDFSQRGPHVTIHAVGEHVLRLPKKLANAHEHRWYITGPLVAGEIANLLSYETVPFDTSDGNLVKNLKAYLQSDKGSWERVPGIRVVWNGVTEETHNPKEHSQCNTLQADIYVERDDVKSLIENEFCPDAIVRRDLQQHSSSISRTYNEGTPNKVTLSMDLETGPGFKHNGDDYIKYLMMAVDGYDPSSEVNPANYKGGGLITIGGDRYRVSPGTLRSAAEKGKQAGCDSAYKVFFNESLQDEVKGYALLPDAWSFEYGLGDDRRE
ncbi:Peptidase-S8 domain-containing protein [Fusarium sp. LHS14.1]|nr:Peptidase-S8 domain-containing protein [Fusarium sp. LHS14.1]